MTYAVHVTGGDQALTSKQVGEFFRNDDYAPSANCISDWKRKGIVGASKLRVRLKGTIHPRCTMFLLRDVEAFVRCLNDPSINCIDADGHPIVNDTDGTTASPYVVGAVRCSDDEIGTYPKDTRRGSDAA